MATAVSAHGTETRSAHRLPVNRWSRPAARLADAAGFWRFALPARYGGGGGSNLTMRMPHATTVGVGVASARRCAPAPASPRPATPRVGAGTVKNRPAGFHARQAPASGSAPSDDGTSGLPRWHCSPSGAPRPRRARASRCIARADPKINATRILSTWESNPAFARNVESRDDKRVIYVMGTRSMHPTSLVRKLSLVAPAVNVTASGTENRAQPALVRQRSPLLMIRKIREYMAMGTGLNVNRKRPSRRASWPEVNRKGRPKKHTKRILSTWESNPAFALKIDGSTVTRIYVMGTSCANGNALTVNRKGRQKKMAPRGSTLDLGLEPSFRASPEFVDT
ncbi:hypothetical protein GGX14DRAFT_396384 [Mycena pura]|uniref:Uncharacterized protein n=1 Tax=Mycena pura TaxID=153505 RepID=A0AAD6VAH9_9AGAR|nr:hypothetical protein GGX14DRAFT_396384 [Mycena pura]